MSSTLTVHGYTSVILIHTSPKILTMDALRNYNYITKMSLQF